MPGLYIYSCCCIIHLRPFFFITDFGLWCSIDVVFFMFFVLWFIELPMSEGPLFSSHLDKLWSLFLKYFFYSTTLPGNPKDMYIFSAYSCRWLYFFPIFLPSVSFFYCYIFKFILVIIIFIFSETGSHSCHPDWSRLAWSQLTAALTSQA